MRRHFALVTVVAVALASGTLAVTPVATRAAFPGASGDLVYVDYNTLNGTGHIVRYDLDTDTPTELTNDFDTDYGDVDPSWSPGGTMVVFTRLDTEGNGEIWRINGDGTGAKRLTNTSGDNAFPAWSPGGSRIAFASNRYGSYDIFTMDLNGGTVRRLTSHPADDLDPAWSPDNLRIAFSSDRRLSVDDQYFFEIYTMSPSGASVVRETNGLAVEADDYAPDWHPQGSALLFTRTSATNNTDILQINMETRAVATVVGGAGTQSLGVFAPSQGFLLGLVAYQSNEPGDWDIAITDKSGGPVEFLDIADDQVQPDWQPEPVFPLVDWRFSPFANDIEWIYDMGLTGGCTQERYCPGDPVTRAQMAIFLDRALPLPDTAIDFFNDDNGKTGEASINRLAAAGITGGCATNKFCPTASVTRGQMAAFLSRALELPPAASDHFTDDETSTYEPYINRVAEAGITGGCGGGKYCPLRNVTRGEMAAFLRRAFE